LTPLIASISGVRGIYNDGLTPEVIKAYSYAFGTLFGPKIVIGRDTRISGPEIEEIVTKALIEIGCSPILLGIASTPTTQLAVEKLNADGGIVITASHNPEEWNALKLVASNGSFLSDKDFNDLQKLLGSADYTLINESHQANSEVYEEAINDHLNLVLGLPYIEAEKN